MVIFMEALLRSFTLPIPGPRGQAAGARRASIGRRASVVERLPSVVERRSSVVRSGSKDRDCRVLVDLLLLPACHLVGARMLHREHPRKPGFLPALEHAVQLERAV